MKWQQIGRGVNASKSTKKAAVFQLNYGAGADKGHFEIPNKLEWYRNQQVSTAEEVFVVNSETSLAKFKAGQVTGDVSMPGLFATKAKLEWVRFQ